MSIVVWAAFDLMAIGAVLGSLAFWQVVEIEFIHFDEQWLMDGEAVGGQESRGAASLWRSGFMGQRVLYAWLIQTPRGQKNRPRR